MNIMQEGVFDENRLFSKNFPDFVLGAEWRGKASKLHLFDSSNITNIDFSSLTNQ